MALRQARPYFNFIVETICNHYIGRVVNFGSDHNENNRTTLLTQKRQVLEVSQNCYVSYRNSW